METDTACPCGRTDAKGKPLARSACCGRYLDDFEHDPAPDAESLMRSRYSAFTEQNAAYLFLALLCSITFLLQSTMRHL